MHWPGRPHQDAGLAHPVTITVDSEPPGPVVPDDFAGLSFERGPLNPGQRRGGRLPVPPGQRLAQSPCSATWGCATCGSAADRWTSDPPAGTGPDGLTGVDNLFAFAAAAGATGDLLAPPAEPRRQAHRRAEIGRRPGGRVHLGALPGAPGQLRDRERAGLARVPQLPGPSAATRPSTRRSAASRAAPTRRTWPPGRTSPTRCGRRRPARRWPGRTPGPTRTLTYTPDPRHTACPGPSGSPATSATPAG